MSETDEEKAAREAAEKQAAEKEAETSPGKDLEAELEKWKALARKNEAQAKANADAAKKLAALEEADKTESQKAADKAAGAEQRATTAEARLTRLEVALDKAPQGMPLAKVRKLAGRLTGDSREDLETDAEELFADFAPETGDDDANGKGGSDGDGTRRRPTERLRPGNVPDAEPEETEPAKLAEAVPRRW